MNEFYFCFTWRWFKNKMMRKQTNKISSCALFNMLVTDRFIWRVLTWENVHAAHIVMSPRGIKFPPTRLAHSVLHIWCHTFNKLATLKPGSHERHKHKQWKQRMNSPLRLEKTKQREFFFVSPFVLLFAYAWTMILCLCLWRSLCRRLDFIPLFCLLFCPDAYAYAIVLKQTSRKIPNSKSKYKKLVYCRYRKREI